MKFTGKTIVIVVLLIALATGSLGAKKLLAQRQEVAALKEQTENLRAEIARRRQTLAQNQLALTQIRADLADLAPAVGENDFVAADERQAWLGRTHQLRYLFARQPDQMIPELKLLTDRDWLSAARSASFASDEDRRKALAAARSTAKFRFVGQLDAALRRFTKNSGGQLPADMLQLVTFFDPPPDTAMLLRYHLTRSGTVQEDPTDSAIEENSLIDPDHDSLARVQASGGFGSSSGPMAALSGNMQRALKAYQKANSAPPKEISDIFPYFNPPLTPAQQQKFLELTARGKTGK